MRKKIIDLGMHPYADTFISKNQLKLSEPIYPLECYLDVNSSLVSLGIETNPDERYNLYDYSYTSSNSEYSKNYWNKYANDVHQTLNSKENSKTLEIGSNDGYLLSRFKKLGHDTLGIDSSELMNNVAIKNGIKSICGIFNFEYSELIKKDFMNFDLIIANNVFNHANDPFNFAKGVKNILSKNGVFIFELPYWYDTIKDKRFDQIYHEHVSYFTVKSAVNVLKKEGLNVYKVEHTEYHGGSIRVFSSITPNVIDQSIKKFIQQEEELGLFDEKFYIKYMSDIKSSRANLLIKINNIILKSKPIVAVGAAAKGNTLLNYYGLNKTIIDYVTDSSTHKIGKFTPLSRIPILSDQEVFSKYDEVYVLILSWNISDILKEKLIKINPNIKFINL